VRWSVLSNTSRPVALMGIVLRRLQEAVMDNDAYGEMFRRPHYVRATF
jgi:hypothetical protein